MNKTYIKRIADLIRTDIITMNGGKNNMKTIVILLFAFTGVFGFIITPLVSVYTPVLFSTFFVPMIFQNEMKFNSEKMYSVIPIERKDLVRSRFIMSIGLFTIISLIFYLLMILSLELKLYRRLFYGQEEADVLRSLAARSGIMTETGILDLSYILSFSCGLMMAAGNLRKYFKNSKVFSMGIGSSQGILRKADKKEIKYGIIAVAVMAFTVMMVCGIIPIGTVGAVIGQMISQLLQAANGLLLCVTVLTYAGFSVAYKYIAAVNEYEEKEL